MTMASRIGVMSEGRILQVGRPADIYETPNCKFVADFIGSVNLFAGKVIVDEPDHVVIQSPDCRHFVSHGITGTADMEVHVAVRPEKIWISSAPPPLEDLQEARQAGYNTVQGKVVGMSYLGSHTGFHVQLASGQRVKVTKANDARHDENAIKQGDSVHLSWWGSDIVVLTQ